MKLLGPRVFSISQVDQSRLVHLEDSLAKAMILLSLSNKEEFLKNEVLNLAVTRLVELVGEGSRKVSSDVRNEYPSVDWVEAARMRNKLVHDYLNVDLDIVWDVVHQEFPLFLAQIQEIMRDMGLQ